MIANSVDLAMGAAPVPESSASGHRTVVVVDTAGPRVVVTVIRGEHRSVVVAECITGVTRESRHAKLVVTWLPEYNERTVLGIVPAEITK